MATMDHYKKLLGALIELQVIGNELFSQLVVEHKDSNLITPEKACAEILSNQLANLKNVSSLSYPCNEKKIYFSKIPPTVNRKIDIQKLDTTLRYDLMMSLEGFPISKPKNPNKRVRCTGACGKICKRKDFCCDHCNKCKQCNGLLPYQQQCVVYKLGVGLNKEKKLRNLFSHLTSKTLKDFLDGNEIFPDFATVNDWKDLYEEFYSAMSYICEYMSDQKNFLNPHVNILAANEKADRLSKLELILNEDTRVECDLNLVVNLKQILTEEKKQQLLDIDDMFDEYIFHVLDTMTDQHEEVLSKIESLKTEAIATQNDIKIKIDQLNQKQDLISDEVRKLIDNMNAQNVKESNQTLKEEEEKEKNWRQKGWRSIYGGVVIQLDDGHEKVELVSCTKTTSPFLKLTIKQKSHVPNILKDPYFETDHSLVKIENMENGAYQIEVKGKSGVIIKSVIVECNKINHPVHNIDKVGVAVPSSDVNNYWENVIKRLEISTPDDQKMSWVSKGTSATTKSLKDFKELGKQYLERNFPDLQETIRFPPDQIEDKAVESILEELVTLLKRKYIDSSKRKVILVSPNFDYHLRFIKNDISSMDEKKIADEQCLSLFAEEESLIMVMRISSDPQQLEASISRCQEDILSLLESHGRQLTEEQIRIVGVIACPSITREQLNKHLPFHFSNPDEIYRSTLFLCKEDLDKGSRSLRKWWDTMTSNLHKQFDIGSSNINHNFFSTIIGQHMASMASTQEGLPTLIGDSHEQLQSLIMNRFQLQAIYSKSKIKLISAPFGAGKTVVGQKILKELSKEIQDSQDPGVLCYITCDPYSMVDVSVQMSMRSIKHSKVEFLCGSLHDLYREHVNKDLSTVSLDALIKTLTERCQKTYMVVDEINESVMTKEVATNINELLNKAENQCRITFIRQSIKKDRDYKHENQTYLFETDYFNIIQELKIYELPKVMRMTIENQSLVDIVQNIITNHKVEVPLPPKQSQISSISETSKNLQASSILEVSDKVSQRDNVTKKHDASLSTDSMTVNRPQDEMIQEISTASTNDIELSLKLLSKTQENANTGHSIVTGFQCISGQIGHAINDRKPEIICFTEPISLNNDTDAKLLFYISTACCFKHDDPVFIATSIESAKMFYFMIKACNKEPLLHIPYLQQRKPSYKEKQDIVSKMQQSMSVLITDHRSFLGMESKSITTFADPAESPNSLIEIISRCTICLQIFVPYHGRSNEGGILSEILQAWKGSADTKNIRVDRKSKHNQVCVKKKENIIVSTNSDEFSKTNVDDFYPNDEEFRFISIENISRLMESKVAKFQPTVPLATTSQTASSATRTTPLKKLTVSTTTTTPSEAVTAERATKPKNKSFMDSKVAEFQPITPLTTTSQTALTITTTTSESPVTTKRPTKSKDEILHRIDFEGNVLSFRDVFKMLEDKDFRSFKSIIDVDPNIINNLRNGADDETFLMEAIWRDRVDIVRYLTSKFTEQIAYMAKDCLRQTAFHYSAHYNKINAMNILIPKDRRGLESRDNLGETPLFHAALNNHKSMVKLLLQHGVDPHAKNRRDLTADQQEGVNVDVQIIIQNYQTKNASTGTS